MTIEKRNSIMSKEILQAEDIMELYNCSVKKAYELIQNWKYRLMIRDQKQLRINVKNGISIYDYFDALDLPLTERFTFASEQ